MRRPIYGAGDQIVGWGPQEETEEFKALNAQIAEAARNLGSVTGAISNLGAVAATSVGTVMTPAVNAATDAFAAQRDQVDRLATTIEQLNAREDAAGVPRQVVQQTEFCCGHGDHLAAQSHLHGAPVKLDLAKANHVG